MKQKTKKTILGVLISFMVLFDFGAIPVLAQAPVDPAFNPGFLISDESFGDVGTFGSAAGVQKFFEQRGSVLANTSPEFLLKLKEPDTLTKVGLEDPQPDLTRLRTAAELIYDAAQKTGLNPQVLLVILQKEQGLVTNSFSSNDDLQRALDRAFGFGCPDYEGCGDIFLGFYRQLFGTFDANNSRWLGAASSLMRSFRAEVGGVRVGRGPMVDALNQTFGRPVVKTARKGDTIILDNTLGGYDGVSSQQTVTLTNFATAALYRYTPHVFNGNYNFWKFYSMWFKYPNGTVFQKTGDATLYVVENGTKRQFSTFVAQQRKFKLDNIITVSQIEFDSYFTEKPLPPIDGTLIMGDVSPAVYLVQDTVKLPISSPVFTQRKLSFAKVIKLPQAEVDGYGTGTYLAPLNGTFIVGGTDSMVYQMDGDLKRPISAEVFKARKLSFGKIMKLTDTEVKSFPTGQFLTPPEQVALKLTGGDGSIYWFKNNEKRLASAFVYKQRGIGNFPLLTLSGQEFSSIATGTPLPPKDGTIIKGDVSTAIYKMENGLKRGFTAASYKRFGRPKAIILPQAEVDGYAEGEIILK